MVETFKDKPFTAAPSGRFTLPSLLRLPPAPHQRRARRSRLRTVLTVLVVACLVLSPLYLLYKPPSFLIHFFQRRWPDVLFSVDTKEKLIALTIDDAPSGYTDEIRTLLKENEAKATFFVIGSQVEGKEQLLADLVLDGHELGNHAMRDEPSRDLPTSKLVEQIADVDKLIHTAYTDASLHRPSTKFFRPGSGFFTTEMRNAVHEQGYRMVLGSVYPHDPQIDLPSLNSWHILSMLTPGAIVICHDRREWTVPMLRLVLPEMRRRGWSVVSVSELLRRTGQLPDADGSGAAESGATETTPQEEPKSRTGMRKNEPEKKVYGEDGKGNPLVEDLLREGDEGGGALEEQREG